jgi:hypothetical protein
VRDDELEVIDVALLCFVELHYDVFTIYYPLLLDRVYLLAPPHAEVALYLDDLADVSVEVH